MKNLYRSDSDLIAWWGTRVECDSALSRLEREAALSAASVSKAFERLDRLVESWQEVQPRDVLRDLGRRLLRTHPLRAADALQLAAALVAAEGNPQSLPFVCLDDRLALAAQREGFIVVGAASSAVTLRP